MSNDHSEDKSWRLGYYAGFQDGVECIEQMIGRVPDAEFTEHKVYDGINLVRRYLNGEVRRFASSDINTGRLSMVKYLDELEENVQLYLGQPWTFTFSRDERGEWHGRVEEFGNIFVAYEENRIAALQKLEHMLTTEIRQRLIEGVSIPTPKEE